MNVKTPSSDLIPYIISFLFGGKVPSCTFESHRNISHNIKYKMENCAKIKTTCLQSVGWTPGGATPCTSEPHEPDVKAQTWCKKKLHIYYGK